MNRTLCIQVELAVGWPDHSWTDGHYIYVPETAGDAVSAAIEKLTEEFNTAGTECAFITSYSVEEEQRFTEDGERVEGISAEAHSDDRACEVFFDATVYFVQASDEDLAKLAACGWGGDYPADEVAQFMAGRNKQLAELFKYVEIAHRVKKIGFECHVNAEEAMVWLEEPSRSWPPGSRRPRMGNNVGGETAGAEEIMSCQRECRIVEIDPGKWYCILERTDSAKDAWDWKEYAEAFGPFMTAEDTHRELDRHSNPGGYGLVPYSPRNREFYAGPLKMQKKAPASEVLCPIPTIVLKRAR